MSRAGNNNLRKGSSRRGGTSHRFSKTFFGKKFGSGWFRIVFLIGLFSLLIIVLETSKVSIVRATFENIGADEILGDTFVMTNNPTTNYGTLKSMQIFGTLQKSYISFDLSSIPDGATITEARVWLYVVTSPWSGGVQVWRTSDTWNENTLTWNTQPGTVGSQLDAVSISTTGWKSWNITVGAQNGKVENDKISLVFTHGVSDSQYWVENTKEADLGSFRPYLEITYTGGITVPSTFYFPYGMHADGNYLYVTYNGTGGLPGVEKFDISLPYTIENAGSYYSATYMNTGTEMCVHGDYVYFLDFANDRITILNKNTMAFVASLQDHTYLNGAQDVYVQENENGSIFAYVTAYIGGYVTRVDVTSPTTAVLRVVDHCNVTAQPITIDIQDNYAFVTRYPSGGAYNTGQLVCVDIRTMTSAGTLGGLGSDGSAIAEGNYVYYSGYGDDTFRVISIQNVASMSTVGSTAIITPGRLDKVGNYVYTVGAGDNSVNCIDVSSPTAPENISKITDGVNLCAPMDICVYGDYVYVTSPYYDSYNGQILVYARSVFEPEEAEPETTATIWTYEGVSDLDDTSAKIYAMLWFGEEQNPINTYFEVFDNSTGESSSWFAGTWTKGIVPTISVYAELDGLLPSTTYFFRAYGYVTGVDLYIYGEWENFRTIGYVPPQQWATIETLAATNISDNYAVLNARLTFNDWITVIGVYFWISTDNDLTFSEDAVYAGEYWKTGSVMSVDISTLYSDLTPNTIYYFMAIITSPFVDYTLDWRVFRTTSAPVLPGVPGEGVNMGSWADRIGNALFGGTTLANGTSSASAEGGMFLSMIVLLMVILPLVYFGMPPLGTVSMIIVMIGFTTLIGWMPMWIAFVVGLGFSIMLAKMFAGV